MNDVLLRMEHITKRFPGVTALEDVTFEVKAGTTHALMGENGAGKSTLMKILVGMYPATSGKIFFQGQELDTSSINKVINQGISMIYQELNPISNMTVAENIFIGREPYRIPRVMLDRKKINRDAQALFENLGLDEISPTEKVENLTVAKMQMIEIAKAVSYNSKLIIMDEPTSAITERECQQLFSIVNRLKKEGVAFVFITHKMDEVFQISDELTVLRDGRYVGTYLAEELTHDKLVKLMVGREITEMFPKEFAEISEVVLAAKNLTVNKLFSDVSFELHKGEILGFAGLMGAGRTEVMEAIFGVRKLDSGEVQINGNTVSLNNPRKAIAHRIAFLTEDRRGNGCFLPLDIKNNMMVLNWGLATNQFGKINQRKATQISQDNVGKFNVKTPSLDQEISKLSGGNQQKALIARWLMSEPDIIIVDEPTRGIDVGSKSEIHRMLSNLAKQGKAVIMISSELPEVLGMSDRVVIMHEGHITGILNRDELNQDIVMRYATGLENQFKEERTNVN